MSLIGLLTLATLSTSIAGQPDAYEPQYPCDEDSGCDDMFADDTTFDLLHVHQRLKNKVKSANTAVAKAEGAEAANLSGISNWPWDIGLGPTPIDYNPLNEIVPGIPEDCGFVYGHDQNMITFNHGVLYNNLGGTGPTTRDPPELRFYKVSNIGGMDVDLRVTNLSEYFPKSSSNNGVMEAGNVGQINLMCGHSVQLKIEWVQTGTDVPVAVDHSYMTIADIDNSKHGYDSEMFSIYPVSDFWIQTGYEFDLDLSVPGVVTAKSTHFGRGCDNPFAVGEYFSTVVCNDGVVVDQLLRSIMVGFQSTSSITMTFGIEACKANGQTNTHGRNFMLAGTSIPPGIDCTTTTTTTTLEGPTAQDDPHCTNLRGERFTVNQPAEYVFLRIPQDRTLPPLLDARGTMEIAQGSHCGLYITSAKISGAWFGENYVHVRALRRDRAGSNTMGNTTEWPFSLKLSTPSRAGSWTPMDSFAADNAGVQTLTDRVSIAAVWKENFGNLLEGQTFELRIGSKNHSVDSLPTTITIAQASHQALNFDVKRLSKTGESEIGGLLGTEEHDRKIEELTKECKEAKVSGGQLLRQRETGSLLSAAWA